MIMVENTYRMLGLWTSLLKSKALFPQNCSCLFEEIKSIKRRTGNPLEHHHRLHYQFRSQDHWKVIRYFCHHRFGIDSWKWRRDCFTSNSAKMVVEDMLIKLMRCLSYQETRAWIHEWKDALLNIKRWDQDRKEAAWMTIEPLITVWNKIDWCRKTWLKNTSSNE